MFYRQVFLFIIPQNSWKWFIYTRTQNVNRSHDGNGEPPRKAPKRENKKHSYPEIPPPNVEDDTSNVRNLELLEQELAKTEPSHDILMSLMTRTFPMRRPSIVDSEALSVKDILKQYPLLKRSAYVSALN